MPLLIGIDIGTTGAKSILMNERGRVLASDLQEYPLSLPQAGWAEQDPEHWWQATCRSIHNLLSRSGTDPRKVSGLALSGQMHGSVFLDENGKVIRPALLWNDQRTGAECEEIEAAAGSREALVRLVGNKQRALDHGCDGLAVGHRDG